MRWIIEKYPHVLIEAVAFKSLFISLGFDSKDMYVVLNAESRIVSVLLKAAGEREIEVRVGGFSCPEEELMKLWKELVGEWNSGGSITSSEKFQIQAASIAFRKKEEVRKALHKAGIRIPVSSFN